MVPPAPPRFSMTIGCLSAADSGSIAIRPMMSTVEPALNGITTRNGRFGQLSARAGRKSAGSANAAPRRRTSRRVARIEHPPGWAAPRCGGHFYAA
jgi:hypothetical protein